MTARRQRPQRLTARRFPVTVQLRKDGGPLCLQSTFADTDAKENNATQFRAKQ